MILFLLITATQDLFGCHHLAMLGSCRTHCSGKEGTQASSACSLRSMVRHLNSSTSSLSLFQGSKVTCRCLNFVSHGLKLLRSPILSTSKLFRWKMRRSCCPAGLNSMPRNCTLLKIHQREIELTEIISLPHRRDNRRWSELHII